MCDGCRYLPADGLLEDQPLCLGCAELAIERWAAIEEHPEHAAHFPPLFER